MPEIDGRFVHVYDPANDTGNPKSYNNDHAIIYGRDKLFHKIGILNPAGGPHDLEDQLDHITSSAILQTDWACHDYALTTDESYGETALWAPHIIREDETYYMFYASYTPDGENMGQIFLATSRDLCHWTRHPKHPIISPNAPYARDPMVLYLDGTREYVMYYTANDDQGRGTVAYRMSRDLINWSKDIRYALVAEKHRGSGNTESPFVVKYGKYYYLFVTSWPMGYNTTRVFRSCDPCSFGLEQEIAKLDCHAPEIIEHNGEWYITHCGKSADGLHIAKLKWVRDKTESRSERCRSHSLDWCEENLRTRRNR